MARGRSERKTGHRFSSNLRRCGLAAAALFCFATFAAPGSADDAPIKATLVASVNDGYARLIFDMSEYDDASVRLANNVLVITFKRPIDVSVERLASQIPDYVGTARRDPDGKGIRVALSQEVKVIATPAAEKYFIDLLPASWSGQPPNLPPEVIADLARRAGEADRLERKERQAVAQQRATAEPVRVHAATQPTFTRYVFAIPANTSVSNDRVKERLTLTFDAPIKFDLADVVAALPRAIAGIDTEMRDDSALVRFNFLANVDVRTFRDDGSYVLDIVGADTKPDEQSAAPAAPAAPQQSAAPETTAPATVSPAAANAPAALTAEAAVPAATEKPDVAPPATIAAPEQPRAPPPAAAAQTAPPPADKPAAMPKAEAQIAAPAPQAPPQPAPSADTAKAEPPAALPAPSVPPPPQRDAAAAPDNAPANAAPPPHRHAAITSGKDAAELSHRGANLKLSFGFATSTAAAVFNRAYTL